MAHPLFGPELREMIAADDEAALAELCDVLHPATIAGTLAEDFSVDEAWRVLRHTTLENQAAIFEYFPPEWQEEMVAGTGQAHMAQLIEEMSSDDRAALLRRLPPQVSESLLRLVDDADRRDIALLARYAENTAGALMTTDYAWLPDHITVGDALERLRLQAPDTETIYYVYVVNEQRQLLGVVSLRDLILKPRSMPIAEVMETQVVSVKASEDREKVAQEMARFDLIAMPVVDDDGRLVGIVTHDDVIDVVVEEATEDVHKMGGVGPIEENYLEAGIGVVWRKRAVWLACLFVGGLFTFSALEAFEDAISEVVVLSLFVPLVISTGGNTGSQAATLITRSMSLGQVTGADWRRVLRHEVVMGVLLGLTLGGLGYLRAAFTPADVRSGAPPRFEPFTVAVDEELKPRTEGRMTLVTLPAGAEQVIRADHEMTIALPPQEEMPKPTPSGAGRLSYVFPRKCTVPRPPVDRWQLALVIALSVMGICLWGTLVGSMLPMVFNRVGVDPAMASSPFVTTFVDVTGIVIYFNIAQVLLAPYMA